MSNVCIVCFNVVSDFVSFSGVPAYESRFDDTLGAGMQLRVVVCDSCLANASASVTVVRTRKTVVVDHARWHTMFDHRSTHPVVFSEGDGS